MGVQPVVLLVDGDEGALDSMAQALTDQGVSIARATDGITALTAAHKLKPVAIVLDLILPELSGAAVMARLRSEGNDVPIVLCSSVTVAPTIGEGVEFLPKPCDPDLLRAAVARALSRTR